MSHHQVVLRAEAREELGEAFDWYEGRRPGLGHQFVRCVSDAIDLILTTPEAFPRVHGEVRRALVRRFPHGIFYIIEADIIVVLAVFHARRDPADWKRRT